MSVPKIYAEAAPLQRDRGAGADGRALWSDGRPQPLLYWSANITCTTIQLRYIIMKPIILKSNYNRFYLHPVECLQCSAVLVVIYGLGAVTVSDHPRFTLTISVLCPATVHVHLLLALNADRWPSTAGGHERGELSCQIGIPL